MIRQSQQQKQILKLTPQQILLMKLIQMPVSDLARHIKDEVEKNPLLEEVAPSSVELPEAVDDEDDDWDDEDYRYRERMERDKNERRTEHLYAAEESTLDRLIAQLDVKSLTDRQRTIAREIVGSIDENGYLSRDLMLIVNDLAFRQGLEVSPREAEEVLAVIQQCDPVGIGARNLQECLSVQLHHLDYHNAAQSDAILVVDQYFDLFSRRQYERIQERCGWDRQRLEAAIQLIQRLNPKPGLDNAESGSAAPYVVPDFYVTLHGSVLTVAPNDAWLPALQLNEYYNTLSEQLSAGPRRSGNDQATLTFLRTQADEARTFIDTLGQRQHTLGEIVDYIVRYQSRYFISGDPCDLRPLQQKDVAEATGYDTSTVSRVVNGKYLQTDFGVVALKDCFTKALSTGDGDEVGVEHIKATLRRLVEQEDKSAPLTDEALTAALKNEGIPVARRTVAKYREMLGIPVGRLRRQLLILFLILNSQFLILSSFSASAQVNAYYDSLINAQMHTPSNDKKSAPPDKDRTPYTKKQSQLRPTPPPAPPVQSSNQQTDTTNSMGVGVLWYGNHFSSHRVRERVLPLDSLPDEINLRLVKNDTDFCFPVKGVINSPYGWRWERAHRGVDIRLTTGTPVRCAFAGVVRVACPMGAYGNLIVVRHYNGLETAYAHLSKINVKPRQAVQAGDIIGLGGSTGRSTGPHLHFEVRFLYENIDPEWLLDFTTFTLRTKRLHLDKSYFGVTRPKRGEALAYKADKSYVKEQPESNGMRYYTVKEEDDLQLIALKCRTTVAKLKELNPEMKKVKKGMRLRVK